MEWEAEDPAEVELSSTLDEDEEAETDDDDEEDDWMVGDDEIEFEEGAEGYIEETGASKKEQQAVEDYYTEVGKAGAVSRNQRFTRLVPFQKGPCLETRLGEVDPVMDKYKICMLNGQSERFDVDMGRSRETHLFYSHRYAYAQHRPILFQVC
jgi:hypothetical protein